MSSQSLSIPTRQYACLVLFGGRLSVPAQLYIRRDPGRTVSNTLLPSGLYDLRPPTMASQFDYSVTTTMLDVNYSFNEQDIPCKTRYP